MNDIEILKQYNISVDEVSAEINYRKENTFNGMHSCNNTELIGYSLSELENIKNYWFK
jgi:hypothetical protein